jgi:hypothetical protein
MYLITILLFNNFIYKRSIHVISWGTFSFLRDKIYLSYTCAVQEVYESYTHSVNFFSLISLVTYICSSVSSNYLWKLLFKMTLFTVYTRPPGFWLVLISIPDFHRRKQLLLFYHYYLPRALSVTLISFC